ncbi:MAG: hypothetical protein ACREYC_25500 [Gammaproteobacteria bacterium]
MLTGHRFCFGEVAARRIRAAGGPTRTSKKVGNHTVIRICSNQFPSGVNLLPAGKELSAQNRCDASVPGLAAIAIVMDVEP